MGELPTSPSTAESDDEPSESHDGQWSTPQQSQNHQSGTGASHAPNHSGSPNASAAMQKRRRVTRACDECRRKKIKCDGKQPCTHCTVYSYDCTYDQPSNRRRNPAPQYVEALENRLKKAEALLRSVLPDVNLDDPKYDATMPQRSHVPIKQERHSPEDGIAPGLRLHPSGSHTAADAEKDPLLESMVHEAGSLDLDDQGHWDFYGQSSGMIFLRRMREQFGDLLGKFDGTGIPFMKSSNISERLMSPKSASASPMDPSSNNVQDLPAKACARKLCSCALDDAAALLRFVHQPTFYEMFDRIYNTPREQLAPAEQKFLPLLYSVIALGCLFAKAEESMLQSYGYKSAIDQGFNWFQVARQMMDVTDCRDLSSLQTLLFMIMFLQASAKLSTCYSHIGIALRSAVRMGLHRSVPTQFPPIEQESRKRIFWVIRNMDIYVGKLGPGLTASGALLGLPMMLSNEDIDQELPLEIDDEYILDKEVLPMPPGKTSVVAAFNAHVRLVALLAKTVRYVYPLHTMRSKSNHAYVVSHAKIREVEQDMQRWMEDLPMALRPGGEAPPGLIRVQQLLRLSYGHIQMILYRPFLHYASQSTQAGIVDKRSYACAAACVSVSRNVIHITSEMKRNGLLTGAYWFAMYTTFFAVLSLVFYVIENPGNPASQAILRDAHEGRDTLTCLAPRSMAADRSSQYLAELFEQLPEALKSGRLVTVSQKKRSAPPKGVNHSDMKNDLNATANKSKGQSPTGCSGWSSTSSGVENANWKRVSGSYNSPSRVRQPLQNVQSISRQSPQQAFTPAAPTTVGFVQGTTPVESMPIRTTESNFSTSQAIGSSDIPNLSTMMFPSNDPFAYPNQPMTTLETYHGNAENQTFSMQLFDNGSVAELYNNLNAPFYRPLPSHPVMGTQRSSNISANQGDGQTMGADGNLAWGQNPQQGRWGGPPGPVTWDAMFGEDWSGGWADQGYRQ
ncbi:MAG: hypothetical protein Q9166_005730 [cf. Caloplaca sp. 2 TL-2023]